MNTTGLKGKRLEEWKEIYECLGDRLVDAECPFNVQDFTQLTDALKMLIVSGSQAAHANQLCELVAMLGHRLSLANADREESAANHCYDDFDMWRRNWL